MTLASLTQATVAFTMSQKKEKNLKKEAFHDEEWESLDEKPVPSRSKNYSHGVRQVNPLGMRVLVKIRHEGNQTPTGLYLPDGAKDAMNESVTAEVIEVASALDEDTKEEANVSGIPLGAIVLIPKRAGVRIPWDEDLRIVETKEVLAIIYEMNVS